MSKMATCPAEGCDYGPQPINSVAAHFSGTKDDAHQGGYERAKTLIESDTVESEDSAETQPPETESATQSTETEPPEEPDGGEEPPADAPTPPPEPDRQEDCPECGGDNWFDPAEGIRQAGGDQSTAEAAEYDRGCADCSTEDRWVVWYV